MSLELDDLPRIDSAGRLGRRAGTDTAVADAYGSYRPEGGIQLSSLHFSLGEEATNFLQDRIFPSSAKLAALAAPPMAGPNYTTYSDCGGFHYGGQCNNPCFGYAPDHMAAWYCATCAEQAADPSHNPPWNWHFTGSRGQIQYMDQPSNPCNGRDAWKWKVGACGTCQQSAIFRCHDGYKKVQNGAWEPTICEGLISCDNNLTHCP
jgi:hypothetical protein